MTSVFKDLCTVTKLTPRPNESYADFATRIHKKVNVLQDDMWDGLSREAQDWNNSVVSPIEQRSGLIAENKLDEAAAIEVPAMEGYKPLVVSEEASPVEASPVTRRRPGRPPAAKPVEALMDDAKPARKAPQRKAAHAGNSKVAPAMAPVIAALEQVLGPMQSDPAMQEHIVALEERLIVVEAELKTVMALLLQISGGINNALSSDKVTGLSYKKAAGTVNKSPKENGPVASPKQKSATGSVKFRAGSVAHKIVEVLGSGDKTTPELLKHFNIAQENDVSFRQRLVDLKRKGIITSTGRGQPWHLSGS